MYGRLYSGPKDRMRREAFFSMLLAFVQGYMAFKDNRHWKNAIRNVNRTFHIFTEWPHPL